MDTQQLKQFAQTLQGKLHYDQSMRILYATDASAYQEMPLAVAIPASEEDIIKLINFANQHHVSLIPRAAGTSLAGQVVGSGIVVDISQTFTKILEVNSEESWVRVQPGVIRDDLNVYLKEYGLYFGPETSTANRAMIGGMVGNNSCGLHSPIYHTTREHTLEVKAILSDGSKTVFKTLTPEEFEKKCTGETAVSELEANIYRTIRDRLSDQVVRQEIRTHFPKKEIKYRRNTGYAIDILMDSEVFTEGGEAFNMCKLICGSEGSLAFITEIKLNCLPLPPKEVGVACPHFTTIDDALRANIIAMKHGAGASELMDDHIIERTRANMEYRKYAAFIEGSPKAVLMIEFARESREEVDAAIAAMYQEMEEKGYGYYFPILYNQDSKDAWNVRKAGLGLLGNVIGDDKAQPVIEDTAVAVSDLPEYIAEFNQTLKKYGLSCVHYAHAGDGELHLRPIINLKKQEGNEMFRTVAQEIAKLVKKYRGSLSGEHGDGRLRAEFIRFMIGDKNYALIKEVKQTWDPQHIFNPGKIVDAPPMNEYLRYMPGHPTPEIDTVFDFSQNLGVLRAAEQCNGSGDCRKTHISGGTMCPSYMATRNEKDTTRARANMLRHFLTNSDKPNRFDHEEIMEVMDLCLSCKGCKAECPSNVDIGKMKAEFLQHYYDANGMSLRTRLIGNFTKLTSLAALIPGLYNWAVKNPLTSGIIKKVTGFAPGRSMPLLHKTTLHKWFQQHKQDKQVTLSGFAASTKPVSDEFPKHPKTQPTKGKVYFFCDEFTNYNDTEVGIKAILLLEKLGYEVEIPKHIESGRTYLSKGMLRQAREIARKNIAFLKDIVSEKTPIIGIEPSAILTLRDEYIDLTRGEEQRVAQQIAEHTFFFDEFIAWEIDKGNISRDVFTKEKRIIKLHGHCHQKALSSLVPSKKMLSLPENYEVHMIPSGCCGMAGSFGYEKEHFDVSMQIGELVLFPTVRKQPDEVIIAAPGTSCRHQIKDGTGRLAKHTAEIMYEALV
ncbi:FAD-binding and (Fe-S)-binding domain-containing protein [Catalinimonas niigatensis]|uniref:FAD-binding and (Fe-S)-binding domain-containing protein n=1 Tax=Catalinimonas niigatensis TaxID=1397264 RepID=UPI0026654481|nr:FAD-binding and (Fe-S)-binding domain-containing protein [Catalinimonas niigatensis]WPP52388.1 FAD-linked oxidase C-terminal domain-containing protein [Catalinimonas niigatensis]